MTTETTERDLIEEVEELLAKATPGPWIAQRNPDRRAGLCVRAPESARPSAPNPAVCRVYDVLKEREANAALIAAAPELLRRLVEEVKILRECHKGPHTIDCALLQQRRGTWTKNK